VAANPSETSGNGLTGPILDHLALASVSAWDNVIRYCYHLGARWMGGPEDEISFDESAAPDVNPPFYFSQVELDGGTKLEFLQPIPGPGSEFLRRFLDRNGPGPHHLTFKVPDIHAAIAHANAAGYDVVNQSFDNPEWQEAFLHPKQSHGIVIQLAQPSGETPWTTPPPLPPSLQVNRPTITMLTHLVADLDAATKLFSGPLDMVINEQGSNDDGEFTDLIQGPWNIRLLNPKVEVHRQWLADRPGRLLQVEMEVDDPAVVPDLRATERGLELPPELNQGTRVALRPRL